MPGFFQLEFIVISFCVFFINIIYILRRVYATYSILGNPFIDLVLEPRAHIPAYMHIKIYYPENKAIKITIYKVVYRVIFN